MVYYAFMNGIYIALALVFDMKRDYIRFILHFYQKYLGQLANFFFFFKKTKNMRFYKISEKSSIKDISATEH